MKRQDANGDYQGTQLTADLEQYLRNETPQATPELLAPKSDSEIVPKQSTQGEPPAKDTFIVSAGMLAPQLRQLPIRAKLHAWWLSDGRTRIAVLDPEKAIGAIVCSDGITTSPIAAYDRVSRRIVTRSGNIYELGMPEAFFAAKGRVILKSMGF